MKLSTNIKLPKSQVAIFPDRCVGCGQARPGESLRVRTHAIGSWTIVLWSFGPGFSVDAPVCSTCKWRIRSQKWFRLLVTIAFAILGVALGVHLLGSYRGLFRKWIVGAVALLILAPVLLWETLFPPAIDLTAYSDAVEYEFRDPAIGREFAALNGAEIE